MPGYQDGWTQTHQWQREMNAANAKFGPIFARFSAMSVEQVAQDPEALKMGGRLFANTAPSATVPTPRARRAFPT